MPLSVLRGERSPAAKWTARDSMLAQALTQHESLLCPGCGQPMWLSMDPETDGRWRAPLPSRCHACTAVHHRAEQYSGPDVTAPGALRFHAELSPSEPSRPPT